MNQPSPARTLRDALEPVAAHAFWSATTRHALADLGLDPRAAYVRGRAAVLGPVTAPVVVSSFRWFEPGLIEHAFHSGPADLTPAEIDLARSAATGMSLRAVRPDAAPGRLADVLTSAVEAGTVIGQGLFCARRARTPPSDEFERLWWAGETLRDHRGDAHIAAAIDAGLGPVELNILTELVLGGPLGEYSATRGWNHEAIDAAVNTLQTRGYLVEGQLTEEGRAVRQEIERNTDRQDDPIVSVIGAELPAVLAELETWAHACIEAGTFPADDVKRRAG